MSEKLLQFVWQPVIAAIVALNPVDQKRREQIGKVSPTGNLLCPSMIGDFDSGIS